MKTIITLLLTMLILPGLFAQTAEWSGSTPGNIYYSSGNVGIGTGLPANGLLHVYKMLQQVISGPIKFSYSNSGQC